MAAKSTIRSKKSPTKGSSKKRKNSFFRRNAKVLIPVGFVVLFAIIGAANYLFSRAGTQVVIKEDFTSSAINFSDVSGGVWNVSSGKYELSKAAVTPDPNVGNANYAIHKTVVKGDFVLDTDIFVPNTQGSNYDDATVFLEWQDPNNYIYASFNEKSNEYTNGIFKITNGQQTKLVSFSATQAPGAQHHVTINRSGSVYSVTVDGKAMGSVSDATYTAGRFGVGTRNNDASFDNFIVSVPVDNTAPSVPVNPATSGVTANQATLNWGASTDDTAVAGYTVYLNGNKVATTANTSYVFSGLSPLKAYSFGVAAFDAAGNSSSQVTGKFTTIFVHPGVLLNKSGLDSVKAKIAAGATPWSTAFAKTKSSKYASSTYTPKPVQYVGCGAHNSPDEGCTQEMDDAIAAYTQALLWYYTGQTAYAQKSIQIMDAWSATLIDHKFDTTKYTNGILQAAWAGETFTRAAEIIRYSNAGWSSTGISRFEGMLNKAFLPRVINGWKWGNTNWLTSMADATVNIGIFTNNADTFNKGIASWRAIVPSAIYLKSDGAEPASPPDITYTGSANKSHWYNPSSYIDGLGQETCRDISHMVMGLEGIIYTAETARIQGYDLYGEQKTRIVAGFELHAKYLNQTIAKTSVTNWVCPAALNTGGTGYTLGFEFAYNAYANRLGVSMPNTSQLLTKIRPTPAALHMDWGTLSVPAN